MGTVDDPIQAQELNSHPVPEPAAVREQLERILSHPIFKNSKRYPAFLRYAVEQRLLGHNEQLKERVIGIEVFNCDLDYDTSNSAIVRVTAMEVRRRLAQYYHEPGHEHEIRIVLHTGSYIPVFQSPPASQIEEPPAASAPEQHVERRWAPAPSSATVTQPQDTDPFQLSAPTQAWRKWLWAIAIPALLSVAFVIWDRQPSSAAVNSPQFDRFWNQIFSAPGAVQLCFGTWVERESAGPGKPIGLLHIRSMDRISQLLEENNKAYLNVGRILEPGAVEINEFLNGPVIYIGGYAPAERMLASGRYGFSFQERTVWVQDRQRPEDKLWRTERFISVDKRSESYAILARTIDRSMNRPIIVIAAISFGAAQAATEVLVNPNYMKALLANAPENWEQMNLEAVIETQIVDSEFKSPKIVAAHFWE